MIKTLSLIKNGALAIESGKDILEDLQLLQQYSLFSNEKKHNSHSEYLTKDEKKLYWGKILNVGLPEVDKIKSEILQKKKSAIDEENRQLFETIDQLILKAQNDLLLTKKLKPAIIRQILGGSSQFLTTGMYLQLSGKGGLGYNKDEVKKAMNMLIDSFTVVK